MYIRVYDCSVDLIYKQVEFHFWICQRRSDSIWLYFYL